MPRRLLDFKLWATTPYPEGSEEFWADISLYNYVCDLYVQKMHGYKPPQTHTILIRAGMKVTTAEPVLVNGYAAISFVFDYNKFAAQDLRARYLHVLNFIHEGAMQLCTAFRWDASVFETAYREVIEAGFESSVRFPAKTSRDRRSKAALYIEKSPRTTSVFIELVRDGVASKIKLLSKKNQWCSDGVYILCRFGKWFDKNSFGIYYNNGAIDIRYSLNDGSITFAEHGVSMPAIDIDSHFKRQSLRAYGMYFLLK